MMRPRDLPMASATDDGDEVESLCEHVRIGEFGIIRQDGRWDLIQQSPNPALGANRGWICNYYDSSTV